MNQNIWFVPHAALTALSMPAPLCPFLSLSGHVVVSPRFPLRGVKPTWLDL
jgi:hypothetical protein